MMASPIAYSIAKLTTWQMACAAERMSGSGGGDGEVELLESKC